MRGENQPQNPHGTGFLSIKTLLFLVLFIAALSSLGTYYFLRSQPQESSEVDTNFLKGILKVFSFRDSKGKLKKIVAYDTGDIQTGGYIYLTDDVFSRSTAIKIGNFGTACCEMSDTHLSDTEKILLAIEISGPSGKEYILANEDGEVISDSVVSDNASEIGLGTIIEPQYGVSSARFVADTKGTFLIRIGNALGEEYVVEINGFTGDYIEGSRRKIK